MAIPSFPRYSSTGADRSKRVIDIERMHGERARWHIYYAINGVLHTHASWAKTATSAAESMAEIAGVIHRGAKYALIGAIKLDRKVAL